MTIKLKDLRFPDAVYLGRAHHFKRTFPAGQPVGVLEHYTAGGSGKETAKMLQGDNGRQVSCHFTVDRDGTAYQCGDLDQCLYHAGISAYKGLTYLNNYFIGIENANYGFLRKVGSKFYTDIKASSGAYVEWKPSNGQKVDQLLYAHHKNRSAMFYWEPYTAAQINTNLQLVKWLIETIPTIKYIAGHDDVAPDRKTDPGPAFPMQSVIDLLRSDNENEGVPMTVKSPDPLNVRGGPGVEFGIISKLDNGVKVKVVRDEGKWSYVEYEKGKMGYVFDSYLV